MRTPTTDRLKESLAAICRSTLPTVSYFGLYRARVSAQSSDLDSLDVMPEDDSLPPMSSIPLRHGIPGVSVQVSIGDYVMVGWEKGDPTRPYCALWESGAYVKKLVLEGLQVYVGAELGAEPPLKGTSFLTALGTLLGALNTFAGGLTEAADPGGAAATALAGSVTTFTAAASASLASRTRVL